MLQSQEKRAKGYLRVARGQAYLGSLWEGALQSAAYLAEELCKVILAHAAEVGGEGEDERGAEGGWRRGSRRDIAPHLAS